MAQIYTWNKQGFEEAYWRYYYKIRGCGASAARSCRCNDTYITYSRNFFETNSMFTERAKKIVNKLNLLPRSKILVAGCALGYLMEELEKLNMQVWGFDNSTYIRSIQNKEKVKFDIAFIDILSGTFKSDVKSAFKLEEFDCVVTEDLLPSHNDFQTIFSNCQSVLLPPLPKSRIVHIVQTNCSPPFTSKTLQQWSELDSSHTWLNQNGDSE